MVDNLSQAIAEAYASAPNDEIIFDTLELRHPSFDTVARLVRDYGEKQVTFSTPPNSITFTENPHAGTYINLDGALVTFVSTIVADDQVLIGATLADTLNNLITFLHSASEPFTVYVYSLSGSSLVIALPFVDTGLPSPPLNYSTSVNGALVEIDGVFDEIYGWMLTLEADAPVQGGETVLFQACMFDFTFMEQRDGQLPELLISVDNVTHLLVTALDEAALSGQAIAVTYREYVASDATEPQFVLDGLTLQRVTAKTFRLEGSAGFFDIVNVNFPNRVYDLDTFPGLIGST